MKSAFIQFGWLIPVVMPMTQVYGRAITNISLFVYLIWAAVALHQEKMPACAKNKQIWILYFGMFFAFLLSSVGADDPATSMHKWAKVYLHTLVFGFTAVVLSLRDDGIEILLQGFTLTAVVLIPCLYGQWYFLYSQEHFSAIQMLREDEIPFLIPFVLYSLRKNNHKVITGILLATLVFSLVYLFAAKGRSAMLGLMMGAAVYSLLVWRPQVIKLTIGIITVVSMALLFFRDFFLRDIQFDAEWLAKFTSERSVMWEHALTHPPDSLLTGVGMGNVTDYPELLAGGSGHLGNLHNVLLDVWNETGFLGLGFFSLFIITIGVSGFRAWLRLPMAQAEKIGVFLASAAAILSSSMLSISYSSWLVSFYLFVLFAAILHLCSLDTESSGLD